MATRIAAALRDAAYEASVELARERGPVPAVQCRPLPQRQHLRVEAAAAPARSDPPARAAQFAPAVDRAHRHHQPRLRRQRQQRHRASLQLELHAQEAHARRLLQRTRGRGPCLAPVPPPAGRRRAVDAGLRHGAGTEGRRPRCDGGGRGAVHRHRDQQDRQRAGRLPLRGLPGSVSSGLGLGPEGPGHLSAERGARRGAERHAHGRGGPAAAGRRRQPAPGARQAAATGDGQPALARAARTARRQHRLELP